MSFRVILAGVCILTAALCLVSAGAQTPAPANPQQIPQASEAIRRDVNLVDVLFTVFNKQNRIVSTLNESDFRITDDGQPQRILFFNRQTDLPLRVGLLMDTSNSIRSRLKFEQEAAIDFLYTVIRRDRDQTFLMTIEDDPQLIIPATSDLNIVRDAILRQRAGGGTALYDAIYRSSEEMSKLPLPAGGASIDLRRVLVVISDGDDTLSRRSRAEALDMAQRAGIVIYTISTSTEWIVSDNKSRAAQTAQRKYMKTDGDKALEIFANDSGGRAFFPYLIDDLALSFAAIGDELRNQYSLAYVPAGRAPDGKFHKIKIEALPKDMQVRTRNGYYAAQPGSSAPVTISAPPR
jgi:VWFA-related protein